MCTANRCLAPTTGPKSNIFRAKTGKSAVRALVPNVYSAAVAVKSRMMGWLTTL